MLDEAVIEFDERKNTLVVRTRTHENFNAMRGFKAAIRRGSWFEFGGSDPDVHIALPEGSSVEVTTASGDTEVIGVLAKATVTSASGNVSVADEVGVLEMKTASGDVTSASVRESLTCHSASGNVRCDGAGTTTKIRTASGSVRLAVDAPVGDLGPYGVGQRGRDGRARSRSRRRRDVDLGTAHLDDAPRRNGGRFGVGRRDHQRQDGLGRREGQLRVIAPC